MKFAETRLGLAAKFAELRCNHNAFAKAKESQIASLKDRMKEQTDRETKTVGCLEKTNRGLQTDLSTVKAQVDNLTDRLQREQHEKETLMQDLQSKQRKKRRGLKKLFCFC